MRMNQTNPADPTTAPPLPRGTIVEHKVDIQVPAAFIWQMLEDVNSWSQWNPIYLKASGSIGTGDAIDMSVAIPGIKPTSLTVTVYVSIPNAHLRYGSPSMAGLIRAVRFVAIESTGPESCKVTNGESMGGLVGRLIAPSVGPKILEALRQMNEGLKQAAESRWRAHS
jgi:hypothetical protein